MTLIFNIQVLLCYSSIQMVFVWCQSINPFLRYGNVNIWRKWPWRSRSINPIFNRALKGPKIHILCENGDSSSNPWRVMARTSSNLRKLTRLSPKWPWRSRSINPIFNRALKGPKIHILCENGDSSLNPWRVMARTSSNLRKLTRLSPKWPWRSRSINPIFNRALEGPKIHILCEDGVSRSNPCRVIARTSIDLRTDDGRTDRRTDGGNDNTLRQNLPRGKNDPGANYVIIAGTGDELSHITFLYTNTSLGPL